MVEPAPSGFGPPEGERSGPEGEGPAVVHRPRRTAAGSGTAASGPAAAGDGSTRVPFHASRHNLTYWRRGRYLGLGAGAHEFDGATRRWNVDGVPAYLAAIRERRRPTHGEERLEAGQARFEALALRLRTVDGLDQGEAGSLGVDPGGAQARELRRAGLLAPGPGLRLTEKGMFLHGEVVTRLA